MNPPLFTQDIANTKLNKSHGTTYHAIALFLSPHKANSQKRNLCPFASPACVRACLNTAGRAGVFPIVHQGRRRKTELYLKNPRAFRAMLIHEIATNERRATLQHKALVVRLNGTSDISYPPALFTRFPHVQFYDYTKNPYRMRKFLTQELPPNYYLTFSYSGDNWPSCHQMLLAGGTVAMVFSTDHFPQAHRGFRVISGETNDLRFLDPPGVIIGLKAKGKARDTTIAGNFVIHIEKRRAS